MTRPLTLIETQRIARNVAARERRRIRAMKAAGPWAAVAVSANGEPMAEFDGPNAEARCKAWGRGLDFSGGDLEMHIVPRNPKE